MMGFSVDAPTFQSWDDYRETVGFWIREIDLYDAVMSARTARREDRIVAESARRGKPRRIALAAEALKQTRFHSLVTGKPAWSPKQCLEMANRWDYRYRHIASL